MSRRVPWVRLASEGAIIVISILLAFGIDAWWDRFQDRTEALEILAGLEHEFENTMADLERHWAENQRFTEALADLLGFEESMDSLPEAERLDSIFQMAVLSSPTWDPSGGVRDAIVSSGRLELIGDLELRAALAAWPGAVEEVRDGELQMQELVRESILPHLASEGYGLGGALRTVIPSWPAPTLSKSQALDQYRRLTADARLRTLLEFKFAWQAATWSAYANASAAGTEILQLIGAARDR